MDAMTAGRHGSQPASCHDERESPVPDTSRTAAADSGRAAADVALTERLSTRISRATDKRLRLFLTIRGRHLGATIDELCHRGLPTLEQLLAEAAGQEVPDASR